jgi:hypothetical protein
MTVAACSSRARCGSRRQARGVHQAVHVVVPERVEHREQLEELGAALHRRQVLHAGAAVGVPHGLVGEVDSVLLAQPEPPCARRRHALVVGAHPGRQRAGHVEHRDALVGVRLHQVGAARERAAGRVHQRRCRSRAGARARRGRPRSSGCASRPSARTRSPCSPPSASGWRSRPGPWRTRPGPPRRPTRAPPSCRAPAWSRSDSPGRRWWRACARRARASSNHFSARMPCRPCGRWRSTAARGAAGRSALAQRVDDGLPHDAVRQELVGVHDRPRGRRCRGSRP